MTIEEMQAAKKQAEEAIARAVQKFMNTTGLLVEDVRIGFVDAYALASPDPVRCIGSITLDVRL